MTYKQEFNLAYVAYRPPIFAPFYYGEAFGDPAHPTPLSPTDRQTLLNQVLSLGFSPVEQIESWCWDPMTVFQEAALQGSSWLPAGQGNVSVTLIGQPGAVVPLGGYSGPPPVTGGFTPVFTNINQLIPFPASAVVPSPPVDPVGPPENGPYYGVFGTNPPAKYTDSRGTFVLVDVYVVQLIGGPTIEKFYVLQ